MSMKSCLPALAMLTLCACAASSPTAPSPLAGPLAGTWNGTLERAGASATLRLELTDEPFGAGSVVNGNYAVTGGADPSAGTVGGITLNGVASLTLKPSSPPVCGTAPFIVPVGDIVLTLTPAGRQMAGSGVIVQCGAAVAVTVTLAK